jgi:hypothetical protein
MATPILEMHKNTYYAKWSEDRRSKRKSMRTANLNVAEHRFAQWLLQGGHKAEAKRRELIHYHRALVVL